MTGQPKKQKVFIEALALAEERLSGIGHAIVQMIHALSQNPEFTATHEIIVIGPGNRMDRLRRFGFTNVTYKGIWIKLRFFNAALKFGVLPPVDLFFGKGLYFFPNYKKWPLLRSKSLTFVYDISFVRFGDVTEPRTRALLVANVPKWIASSTRVVTDSEHAKQEIVDYYKTDPAKVSVVHLAADQKLFYPRSQTEIAAAKKACGIEGEYIMFLSNIEPRKNIGRLVEAYRRLPAELRDRYSLLLIGGGGWNNGDILQAIEDAKQAGCKVIKPNHFVPDEDLPALLSGATALMHPALYEGFGLPPLEAMACGTPVLVGNNSSLPEVVGDAGVYVQATNTDDILAKMTQLLTDEALRTKLSAQGLARAQQFTWQRTGKTLAGVIEQAEKTS